MSIVVIGSRSLLRAGLVSLLRTIGFEKIEEADGIKHLRGHTSAKPSPDMLVVCLLRGTEDSAAAEIRAWGPTTRIVFVAPKLDIDVMGGCFAAGACGYLLETISCDGLRESLNLVNAGEKVFPSELASLLSMLAVKLDSSDPSNSASRESNLSRREIDVLQCLIDGQSNKAMARNLDIAEGTVKVHVRRILKKTGGINRTQAALWAIANGVTPASAESTFESIPAVDAVRAA